MNNNSTLKRERHDVLKDFLRYGIFGYGDTHGHTFAGKYDGVYDFPLYLEVKPEEKNNDVKEIRVNQILKELGEL